MEVDCEHSYTYYGGRLSSMHPRAREEDSPLSSMTLTPHQRTVLNYIVEFQHKRGYSPSLADLALAFGVSSKNAIAKVVNALVREKQLEKDPKGRIKIIEQSVQEAELQPMMLPLFGPISAGAAEEQAEEILNLEEYIVPQRSRGATFLLRVRGDSMIEAGIQEGDLVVVDRNAEPKAEEIVVGVLDGEFTLKRLRKDKGKFYLQAENPQYPDMYALEELQVAGVVRGVIRKY